MGRQTTYKQKTADTICGLIAEGTPLRQICRMENMPAWRTVYNWLGANIEFEAQFARARELGFDAIAEEALEIANTPLMGETEETSENGKKITRADMLGHRKLQIETRLKLLAKWSPKYADKTQIDVKGKLDIASTIIAARRRAISDEE